MQCGASHCSKFADVTKTCASKEQLLPDLINSHVGHGGFGLVELCIDEIEAVAVDNGQGSQRD